jgi:Cu/Ag efflux pump CusA
VCDRASARRGPWTRLRSLLIPRPSSLTERSLGASRAKNAIVMVDYINLMRDRGMSLEEAIQRGGERRLRPVLMTALAILGGMIPLAVGWGEGAEIWRPMAVAVVDGVTVSTLVTLVLIPSIYALTDRWRKRGKRTAATAQGAQAGG